MFRSELALYSYTMENVAFKVSKMKICFRLVFCISDLLKAFDENLSYALTAFILFFVTAYLLYVHEVLSNFYGILTT